MRTRRCFSGPTLTTTWGTFSTVLRVALGKPPNLSKKCEVRESWSDSTFVRNWARLKVSKLQGVVLAESELMEVLPLLGLGSSTYEQMVKFWCSGMCVAVELKGSRCEEILPPLVDRLRQKFASNALEQAVSKRCDVLVTPTCPRATQRVASPPECPRVDSPCVHTFFLPARLVCRCGTRVGWATFSSGPDSSTRRRTLRRAHAR